jgi:hypothetical protein
MDKWRYKLPCGHRAIRIKAEKSVYGNKAHDSNRSKTGFYCNHCNTHHGFVIDTKMSKELSFKEYEKIR